MREHQREIKEFEEQQDEKFEQVEIGELNKPFFLNIYDQVSGRSIMWNDYSILTHMTRLPTATLQHSW